MGFLDELRASLPSAVQIVAVSKKQPIEKIQHLYDQGQRDFGENYSQELIEKKFQLQHLKDLRWHFIGTIQKNKLKHIVGEVALIQSVGSLLSAQMINEMAEKKGVKQPVLLQANLANESTKQGFTERDLLNGIEFLKELPNIEIQGLMTLPPLFKEPSDVRPFFKRLRELRDLLQHQIPTLKELSMGTSHDFRVALEEGATMIRLGTLIFGARNS